MNGPPFCLHCARNSHPVVVSRCSGGGGNVQTSHVQ